MSAAPSAARVMAGLGPNTNDFTSPPPNAIK
jgi:hypothetical protein